MPISRPVGSMNGHDARGRERDAALAQRDAVFGRGNQKGVLDVLVVVERLAHAHHHHIGDGTAVAFAAARATWPRDQAAIVGTHAAREIAEALARHQDLAEDFAGAEIAHQRLRAGVAERAGERAADLRGHAQRSAIFLRDIDGLDLDRRQIGVQRIAVAEQPFARAVDRDLLGDDLGPVEQEVLRQRLAKTLLDIAHPLEIGDAVNVDPVPQLAGAHLGFALVEPDAGQRRAHLRLAQPNQRRPSRRRRTRGVARMIEVEGDAHRRSGNGAARCNIVCLRLQRRGQPQCHSREGGT